MINLVRLASIFGFIAFLIFIARTSVVYAATEVKFCPGGQFNPLCEFNAGEIGTVVGNVLQILLIIAVVLSVIFLVWGGIKWITSGGDKQAVESARGTIVAALIGLIIAFIAFFIISVVLNIFGLSEDGVFTLPKLLDETSSTNSRETTEETGEPCSDGSGAYACGELNGCQTCSADPSCDGGIYTVAVGKCSSTAFCRVHEDCSQENPACPGGVVTCRVQRSGERGHCVTEGC